MVYLILLITLSSCFAAGCATEDAYDYLRKHPRATQSYFYKGSEDQVIAPEFSKFPHKIVGVDSQYDVLYTAPETPESLFTKIITRFIKK